MHAAATTTNISSCMPHEIGVLRYCPVCKLAGLTRTHDISLLCLLRKTAAKSLHPGPPKTNNERTHYRNALVIVIVVDRDEAVQVLAGCTRYSLTRYRKHIVRTFCNCGWRYTRGLDQSLNTSIGGTLIRERLFMWGFHVVVPRPRCLLQTYCRDCGSTEPFHQPFLCDFEAEA